MSYPILELPYFHNHLSAMPPVIIAVPAESLVTDDTIPLTAGSMPPFMDSLGNEAWR